MSALSPKTTARIADLESNKEIWIEEAQFGLKYISPHVAALPPGAKVLEIGAGPCILISELCARFEGLEFHAIEPVAPGFARFDGFVDALERDYDFHFFKGGYEDYPGQEKFDLIYLINTFEHIPDFRDLIRFVRDALTPEGRCVILCPNYGFPYESHFQVPILISPKVTRRLFSRRIETFEAEHNAEGLWDSLNFVKWPEVERACKVADIDVRFDPGITEELIDRLDEDPEFTKRQGILAIPARAMKRTGLLNVLKKPAFYRFHPYMMLELTLPEQPPA